MWVDGHVKEKLPERIVPQHPVLVGRFLNRVVNGHDHGYDLHRNL